MNYIFISKLLLLTIVFVVLKLLYKNINWHSKNKINWTNSFLNKLDLFLYEKFNHKLIDWIIFVSVLLSAIPIIYASLGLFFFILLRGGFIFISEKSYWEQIIIVSGFFLIYFLIKVNWDLRATRIQEDKEYQRKKIDKLEREIELLKKTN